MNTETPSTGTILRVKRFFYLGYVATRSHNTWLITHPSHPSFTASAPTRAAAKAAIARYPATRPRLTGTR